MRHETPTSLPSILVVACVRHVAIRVRLPLTSFFFFFNDTATTEIYTLSLHDALPICTRLLQTKAAAAEVGEGHVGHFTVHADRKSTRLNSSHQIISYAVFCLKKKKKNLTTPMS